MMETVHTSETSVNIYLTTWQYIPEDSKLQAGQEFMEVTSRTCYEISAPSTREAMKYDATSKILEWKRGV
jgi:hypothetical protein